MPTQKIEIDPQSIIARKVGAPPGLDAEKGLITLPGESDREIEELGSGTYWHCLATANPHLQDADHIYPGQSLNIPASCRLAP